MRFQLLFGLAWACLSGFMSREVLAVGPQLIVQTGPATPVQVIALSPDGRLEATGEERGIVRVWNWESGAEMRRLVVGDTDVSALAFSGDGRRLLCAAGARGYVFDLQSGERVEVDGPKNVQSACWSAGDHQFLLCGFREVRVYNADNAKGGPGKTLPGNKGAVTDAVFSPDGRYVLTGGADSQALYINVERGKVEQTIEDNYAPVNCVAISPDGNTALLGLNSRRVRFLDLNIFGETRNISTQGEPTSLRFSPDGQSFLMAANGDATRWISLDNNNTEKGRFEGNVKGAAFSANGERVATALAAPFKAHLWNAKDSKEIAVCQGRVVGVYGSAFSPDSKWLATAHGDGSVQLFSLRDGERHRLELETESAFYVAFSPDGTRLLVGGDRSALALFDIASGKKLFSLTGHKGAIYGVGISGDGKTLLSAGQDGFLKFWNAEDGTEIVSIEAHQGGINALALDSEGHSAATGGADGRWAVWDIAKREAIVHGGATGSPIDTIAWSPDGKQIASGGSGKTGATLWNAQTGKLVRKITGRGVKSLAFEPHGSRLFASGDDAWLYAFDAAGTSHEEVFWDACTKPLVMSPDGRLLAASGDDGLVRLRDLKADRDLCSLATFKAGNWAVVDGEGRFDTSLAGAAASTEAGLVWSYQLAPAGFDQFRAGFEQIGLLGRLLEPGAKLPPLPELDTIAPFPLVFITPPTNVEKQALIRLQNNGGGIGPVQIWVNGKLATKDAGAGLKPNDNGILEIRYLPTQSLINPTGSNTLRVIAQNADTDKPLFSLPLESQWQNGAQNGTQPKAKAPTVPRLFVIAGGISVYSDPTLNLRFAANDARDMAEAIAIAGHAGRAGRQLFKPEQMKIWLLTGENAPQPPTKGITRLNATKNNFAAVFKEIQQEARPDDVVMLYLAGHGGVKGQGSNLYFYLTQEAKGRDDSDPRWSGWTITGEDISGWLRQVAARKTVVVLDTCFVGDTAQTFLQARGAGVAPSRAFERLQDVSGSHILAGCALNAESYETAQLGHGLLTYSLLQGMRGKEEDGKDLDITQWFAYAQRSVPELAKKYGMVQIPQALSPNGQSFPIGMLSEAIRLPPSDVTTIQLLQPRLRDETAGDALGLELLLAKELREQAAVAQCPFTFVNKNELPGAYRVSGEYSLQGNQVTWKLKIKRGDKVILPVEGYGSASDLSRLAQDIGSTLRHNINVNLNLFKSAN